MCQYVFQGDGLKHIYMLKYMLEGELTALMLNYLIFSIQTLWHV